jgi:hypothetical protein
MHDEDIHACVFEEARTCRASATPSVTIERPSFVVADWLRVSERE